MTDAAHPPELKAPFLPIDTQNQSPDRFSEPPPLVEKAQYHDDAVGQQRLPYLTIFSIIALSACYVAVNMAGIFAGAIITFMAPEFGLGMGFDSELLQVFSSLFFGCTAPIIGHLSDIYGRRNALILGMSTHVIGTTIVAASPNLGAALVGYAIAGVGSAIGELVSLAAIAELVPIRQRGLYFSIPILLLLPFVPGVLYAELISSKSSWRFCYTMVIVWSILSFLALALTYFRLKTVRPSQESRRTTLKQMDYLGFVLLIAGTLLFTIGLTLGGAVGYSRGTVLGLLISGIALLIALILWEWKGAKAPLIPFRLFSGGRTVGLAYGIVFISGMSFQTAANLGALILQDVFSISPAQVGLMTLGPSFGLYFGSIAVNYLLSLSRGAARELLAIAAVLMVAFGGALAASTPSSQTMYVVLATFASVGIGGILDPPSTIVTWACPQDLIGTAISLSAFLRTIGGVVGYAIFSGIALSTGAQTGPANIIKYATAAGLNATEGLMFVEVFTQNGTMAAARLPGVTQAIIEAAGLGQQWGSDLAYRMMYYSQIPFGVIAVLLCISLPNMSKFVTDRIVVRTR